MQYRGGPCAYCVVMQHPEAALAVHVSPGPANSALVLGPVWGGRVANTPLLLVKRRREGNDHKAHRYIYVLCGNDWRACLDLRLSGCDAFAGTARPIVHGPPRIIRQAVVASHGIEASAPYKTDSATVRVDFPVPHARLGVWHRFRPRVETMEVQVSGVGLWIVVDSGGPPSKASECLEA